jgi:hypothetical protein
LPRATPEPWWLSIDGKQKTRWEESGLPWTHRASLCPILSVVPNPFVSFVTFCSNLFVSSARPAMDASGHVITTSRPISVVPNPFVSFVTFCSNLFVSSVKLE